MGLFYWLSGTLLTTPVLKLFKGQLLDTRLKDNKYKIIFVCRVLVLVENIYFLISLLTSNLLLCVNVKCLRLLVMIMNANIIHIFVFILGIRRMKEIGAY